MNIQSRLKRSAWFHEAVGAFGEHVFDAVIILDKPLDKQLERKLFYRLDDHLYDVLFGRFEDRLHEEIMITQDKSVRFRFSEAVKVLGEGLCDDSHAEQLEQKQRLYLRLDDHLYFVLFDRLDDRLREEKNRT